MLFPKDAYFHKLLINGQNSLGSLVNEAGQFYFPIIPQGTYKLLGRPATGNFPEQNICLLR